VAAGAEGRRAGDIFLSYRRDDTRHLAGRVYDRLVERFGDGRVFMDVDSIEPGLDFEAVINSAVASCGVMLALIGPTWLTAYDDRGRRRLDNPDDFIVLELSAALHYGIRLLPVLVDGAAPLQATDLPATLRPLARRHAIRLDHETFRSDVNELLTAVARILDRPSLPPEPRWPTQRPASSGPNPPTMWLTPKPSAAPSSEPAGSRRGHPAAGEGAAAHGARPVEARPTAARKRADGAVPAHVSRPRALSAPWPAVAGALVVVTAVLIFVFIRPSDPGTGSPSPTTPSVSAISPQATEVAPFSTGTTAISSTEATVTDPVGFVQSFYGLLPGNTDAAWALLGPSAQAASGGRSGFDSFYAGIERVWVENLRVSGNTVTATIVFMPKDGPVAREGYTFVVGVQDGKQAIESFSH
jgi:hypothetical protein